MHANIPACYQGWQKKHNGACVLSDREEEKGESQAVPSSWVIFNQQYYHSSQKDLHNSHLPTPWKKNPYLSLGF